MIKKPFIFLTKNFARQIVDANGVDVSQQLINISTSEFPYVLTFFFTDKWGKIINRKIDTLILEGTNVRNLIIESADNSGNYKTLFNVAGNIDNTVIFIADEKVETSSLRLTIPASGNPEEVRIKRASFYDYLLDCVALTSADFHFETNQGSYRTLSGNIVFYGDYKKWASKIKIENLPQGQFNIINAAIQEDNILTIIPFQDFEPAAIYESYISPEFSFEVDRKTALYSATWEAQEL